MANSEEDFKRFGGHFSNSIELFYTNSIASEFFENSAMNLTTEWRTLKKISNVLGGIFRILFNYFIPTQ